MSASAMRRCLREGDVPGLRRLWALLAPLWPQPQSDYEALASMHRARTEASSMPLKLRLYSHDWLEDHNLPSGLPDALLPLARRLYPCEVHGVLIAVRSVLGDKERAERVRLAMENAVENAYADGITDSARVRGLMRKARDGAR